MDIGKTKPTTGTSPKINVSNEKIKDLETAIQRVNKDFGANLKINSSPTLEELNEINTVLKFLDERSAYSFGPTIRVHLWEANKFLKNISDEINKELTVSTNAIKLVNTPMDIFKNKGEGEAKKTEAKVDEKFDFENKLKSEVERLHPTEALKLLQDVHVLLEIGKSSPEVTERKLILINFLLNLIQKTKEKSAYNNALSLLVDLHDSFPADYHFKGSSLLVNNKNDLSSKIFDLTVSFFNNPIEEQDNELANRLGNFLIDNIHVTKDFSETLHILETIEKSKFLIDPKAVEKEIKVLFELLEKFNYNPGNKNANIVVTLLKTIWRKYSKLGTHNPLLEQYKTRMEEAVSKFVKNKEEAAKQAEADDRTGKGLLD